MLSRRQILGLALAVVFVAQCRRQRLPLGPGQGARGSDAEAAREAAYSTAMASAREDARERGQDQGYRGGQSSRGAGRAIRGG